MARLTRRSIRIAAVAAALTLGAAGCSNDSGPEETVVATGFVLVTDFGALVCESLSAERRRR